MADAPLLMGIDVGTTAVKVVVYDIGGAERHRYARAYPTARSGGFVEQDPADWMACLDAAFAEIEAAGLAPAIAAIGVTSQVNTHVFCAAGRQPGASRDHLGRHARGRCRDGPRRADHGRGASGVVGRAHGRRRQPHGRAHGLDGGGQTRPLGGDGADPLCRRTG
jgi:hypothetical protein